MKKYFISVYAIGCFTFLISQNISAQQLKIGVFDIDGIVRVLPEYKTIDSLMHIFEEDSLQLQYYTFLDSLLQKGCDGLMGMSESERKKIDSLNTARNSTFIALAYRLQVASKQDSIKRRTFAEPLYTKVTTAFLKIVEEGKYNYILKPSAITYTPGIDSLFILVAKELQLTYLPASLLNANQLSH